MATWSSPGKVEVRVAAISSGFELPSEGLVVMTEEEIFGPRERRRKTGQRPGSDGALALERIAAGDLLVHAEHGIGIYRGLVMLGLRRRHRRVPARRVRGRRPALPARAPPQPGAALRGRRRRAAAHRPARRAHLGEDASAAVKKSHAQHGARAARGARRARAGARATRSPPRDRALEEFEAAFPYEETPDQRAAIEDVLADLQQRDGRWTGWSAATSATARPRSRSARPSRR